MNAKIRFWQWPNILAVDAGVIACGWLWVFAGMQSTRIGEVPYLVLALSVWLTYVADRLFDAGPRESGQLLSARHQFAKRRARLLWSVWALLLFSNIALAVTGLNPAQLSRGFILLLACLGYTCFNHLLSKRFFPKELIVAVIFAGGTQVFLPEPTEWPCLVSFALMCLINCLAIGGRERAVDARLRVRSLSNILNSRWNYLLLASGACVSIFSNCPAVTLTPILALAFLQLQRERFSQEAFRVLCDAALLLGPLVYFFSSGVLVR